MLLTLTLVIVALVVVALAGGLALVAFALVDTRRSIAAIADALEAIGRDTGPLASEAAFGHVGGGGSFGYADPERRLGIGFAKNYFNYATGGAVNQGRPPRAASNVVAEAVFDALGLQR